VRAQAGASVVPGGVTTDHLYRSGTPVYRYRAPSVLCGGLPHSTVTGRPGLSPLDGNHEDDTCLFYTNFLALKYSLHALRSHE
jgi:hypothetical protein